MMILTARNILENGPAEGKSSFKSNFKRFWSVGEQKHKIRWKVCRPH